MAVALALQPLRPFAQESSASHKKLSLDVAKLKIKAYGKGST
jgi:hypothetical protein